MFIMLAKIVGYWTLASFSLVLIWCAFITKYERVMKARGLIFQKEIEQARELREWLNS